MNLLAVALGSALGGLARYGLSGLVHRFTQGAFPFGTLVVNVSGCVAIGGIMHLVEDRMTLGPAGRTFYAVGLLGGFTTFSAFGYETLKLLRDGQNLHALLNVAGNVVLGLAAVWMGRATFRLF
jgi:CrcB protein